MMTMGGSSDGGRRFRRSGGGGLMTEINVTPFVDVMLVLLIIFIVTAPMMQSGIDVNLPKEDSGSLDVKEENIVSLRADGAVFYNDKRYSLDDLESQLREIKAAKPDVNVYLRADKDIPYGQVVEVMGTIRRAGVERLGMVTEVPSEKLKKK